MLQLRKSIEVTKIRQIPSFQTIYYLETKTFCSLKFNFKQLSNYKSLINIQIEVITKFTQLITFE